MHVFNRFHSIYRFVIFRMWQALQISSCYCMPNAVTLQHRIARKVFVLIVLQMRLFAYVWCGWSKQWHKIWQRIHCTVASIWLILTNPRLVSFINGIQHFQQLNEFRRYYMVKKLIFLLLSLSFCRRLSFSLLLFIAPFKILNSDFSGACVK